MTPVDFLIKELKPFLKEKDYVTTDVIFSVAKQLEKQQTIKNPTNYKFRYPTMERRNNQR